MVKYFKYIFLAAITLIAASGCQEDIEDTFSKKPTAPVLVNNGAILLTQNTMSEDITWAWSAARFMNGEVTYDLYAQYEDQPAVQVGSGTKNLSLSVSKTDFWSLIKGIPSVPENASFDINFYVNATDALNTYTSAKQRVKVYAYGNAVSPVLSATVSEVVLDINNPTGNLSLLSWEPARLKYNEAITYNVYMSYNNGTEVEVAKELTGTTCSKTVDEWNELAVSAGAPESAASNIKFTVKAYSATYTDGVPSEPVTINITTYTATYPDALYLPGSYQDWKPETSKSIPHSTLTKGLFESFFDLTSADGSDVEFKFAPEPAWGNDFGSDTYEQKDADGNIVISGKTVGKGNIKVPSGFYRISVNKKLNTFEMVKVVSMGLIGDATPGGWNAETPMTYDAATHSYSVVANFIADKEYKFRLNNNWTYAIGNNGSFSGPDNFKFTKPSGEYKVVVDVSKHPYSVKVLSTAFPTEEYIYVPGNHQSWTPATAPALKTDAFDGVYKGFSHLDGEFKFTKQRNWEAEYNYNDFSNYSAGITAGGGGNLKVDKAGLYFIDADVVNGKLTTTEINSWGVIGDATAGGWDSDQNMTWDADKKCWTITTTMKDGKFKFRANDDWAINLGGKEDNLTIDGDNMGITAGTYYIELYVERTASNNIYCTVTKK